MCFVVPEHFVEYSAQNLLIYRRRKAEETKQRSSRSSFRVLQKLVATTPESVVARLMHAVTRHTHRLPSQSLLCRMGARPDLFRGSRVGPYYASPLPNDGEFFKSIPVQRPGSDPYVSVSFYELFPLAE